MENIKPIKIFIECLLPITACNIKCHYCYVAQRHNRLMKRASLPYSPEKMAKALRKERLGGVLHILAFAEPVKLCSKKS